MEARRPAGRFTVIQHVPFEGPGAIRRAAQKAGLELDIRRIWNGDPLPSAAELEGLVVMGGPMGVADARTHRHLHDEVGLLAAAAKNKVPILAICLGAQLLACALGALVRRGTIEEVGIGTVDLTEAGHSDPLLGIEASPLPVMHWHRDTFEIPRGAVHLARSAYYANQAFRYGGCCYGLQFHLELDGELARTLKPHLPAGVNLSAEDVSRVNEVGAAVLEHYFEVAARIIALQRRVRLPAS